MMWVIFIKINEKRKILLVFDDMIVNMLGNKKIHPIQLNYLSEEEN